MPPRFLPRRLPPPGTAPLLWSEGAPRQAASPRRARQTPPARRRPRRSPRGSAPRRPCPCQMQCRSARCGSRLCRRGPRRETPAGPAQTALMQTTTRTRRPRRLLPRASPGPPAARSLRHAAGMGLTLPPRRHRHRRPVHGPPHTGPHTRWGQASAGVRTRHRPSGRIMVAAGLQDAAVTLLLLPQVHRLRPRPPARPSPRTRVQGSSFCPCRHAMHAVRCPSHQLPVGSI